MNCESAVLLMSEYRQNQLTSEEKQAIEAHLQDCSDCQQELQQTQDLQAILNYGQPLLSETTQEQLTTRIMEGIIASPTLPWWKRVGSWFVHNPQVAMAGGVLVAVIGLAPFTIDRYLNGSVGVSHQERQQSAMAGGEVRLRDSDNQTPVPMAVAPVTPGGLNRDAMVNEKSTRPYTANESDSLSLEESKRVKQEQALTKSKTDSAMSQPPLSLNAIANQSNYASFLIRQGTLSLEVKQVDEALRAVEEIVDKSQGYIVSATLNQPDEGRANADIQLKVPRKFLIQVTAELEHLGSVRQKTLRSEDIWLTYQQQQIEIEHKQGQLGQTEKPMDRLVLQKQLKQEKMERLRLQQMLNMATLDLHLSETAVSQIWDMQQTWESILQQLVRSGRETLLMLTAIVAFLPPLLVYLLVAYVVTRLLGWILVNKLNLLAARTLHTLMVMAVIYFPLYWSNKKTAEAVFSFTFLAILWWAIKTVAQWWHQRKQDKIPAPHA